MRSSLVKQLAVHCSLLLVKTSYTEEGPGEPSTMVTSSNNYIRKTLGVRDTVYGNLLGKYIVPPNVANIYKNVKSNLEKFFNESLLTIRNWNQETSFEDANPGVVEKSILIEKWLKIILEEKPGLNPREQSDSTVLAHILDKHPSRFFIDLCNYILYSLRSLGVNDSINGVLNAKLAELVNVLGNGCGIISEMIRLEKGGYLLPPLSSKSELCDIMEEAEASRLEQLKKMHPEQQQQRQHKKMYTKTTLDGLQATLDYLYLEKCTPALFTIQSYLELLMEVPSETNKGNIAIYSDLFAAYKILQKISIMVFKLPRKVLKFTTTGGLDPFSTFSLNIPTFEDSEYLYLLEGLVGRGKQIEKIFEEVYKMTSINDFSPDILKDIDNIFAELKDHITWKREEISYNITELTQWLLFISYEDNSHRITPGN